MSDYTPKVGHRVRCTIEGRIVEQDLPMRGDDIDIVTDIGRRIGLTAAHCTVERLPDPPPPQPNWLYGDHIAVDDGSLHLLRGADGMWHSPGLGRWSQRTINHWWSEGRVTVLVAEGRAVTA